MTTEKRNQLFTPSKIFFYILAIIVFVLATRSLTKFRDIQVLLSQIKPFWLLVALGAQAVTYVLNALIYYTLLEKDKGSLTFGEVVKMTIVILFVNQALPTGGISGNGYVFHSFTKHGISEARTFALVVYELLCFYATYILIILGYGIWYASTFRSDLILVNYTLLGGLIFYSVLIGIMLIMSNKRLVGYFLKKLSRFRFIQRPIQKMDPVIVSQDHSHNGWRMFQTHTKTSLSAMFFQCLIFLFDIITIYAILQGFHIDVSFAIASFCLLLSLIIGALPLSPGSLIIYESAMTYFFTLMGVPVQAAIIVTLLYRFFSFWLPIPIGLLLYRHLQMKSRTTVPTEVQRSEQ